MGEAGRPFDHASAGRASMRTIIAALLITLALSTARAQDDRSSVLAECDRLAASDLDPDRPASVPGVASRWVDAKAAVPACEAALKVAPEDRRIRLQLGRAYTAAKDRDKACEQYALAEAQGS
jgi:hypothetical protein